MVRQRDFAAGIRMSPNLMATGTGPIKNITAFAQLARHGDVFETGQTAKRPI